MRRRMATETRRARLLIGPRAVGKTTLLRQWIDSLLDNGVDGRRIVYADFEDPRLPARTSLNDVRELALRLLTPSGPLHFILDEIHQSQDWARWLRRLVDRSSDYYLGTDSASAILSGGAVETGQARFDEIRLGCLNFRDFYFLQLHPNAKSVGGGDEELDPLRAPTVLQDYLTLGGFPGHVYLRDDGEARRLIRQDIGDKAIIKDLHRVSRGDTTLLRDLFVSLVEESGSVFDATKWSRNLAERPTRQQVAKAVDLLEGTFLLCRLPRYGASRRHELRGHPKVYAADPGLVSAFARVADPLRDPALLGRLTETAVFRHLEERARIDGAQLSFYNYQNRSECDFVVSFGDSKALVEVTASMAMDQGKARALSVVSGKLRGVHRRICVTQCRSEVVHKATGGEIHELPLWLFLDRLSRSPLREAML